MVCGVGLPLVRKRDSSASATWLAIESLDEGAVPKIGWAACEAATIDCRLADELARFSA
jgi:hypothetical protein